jgi:hypothetical protein
MGRSEKYGRVSTERKDIPDDEPVFVIRARDVTAVPAIRAYAQACAGAGAAPAHLDGVHAAARAAYAWQQENPGLVKLPDTAPGEYQ